jgi:hypothetical protein
VCDKISNARLVPQLNCKTSHGFTRIRTDQNRKAQGNETFHKILLSIRVNPWPLLQLTLPGTLAPAVRIIGLLKLIH